MVVLAFAHQVRCILWVQIKGLAFLWIEILWIEYLLWKILSTKSMFDVANMLKELSVKDVPMNNYELLNIQACLFHMFWNRGLHPISRGKLQVLSSSPNIH